MEKHSIMIDLDDDRTDKIAEVLGNKTCKKIIGLLAEKEMSETDISKGLGIPLNTVGYNIRKLLESGLIEKTNDFFWSVKGKKIPVYRASSKRIIISPKSKIRGIIPAVLVSGAIALGIKTFFSSRENAARTISEDSLSVAMEKTGDSFNSGIYYILNNAENVWAWFFLGALLGLLIFLLWNWREYVKK